MTRAVDVTVPADRSEFVVEDPPPDVDDLLYDELAWEDPDAKWHEAYKTGRWDGRRRLYDRSDHSAPIGLLDRAADLLENRGYDVSVTVEGDRSGDPVDVGWHFDHDLRDYQRQAVRAVLDESGGVVSIPTGGGKTVVGLRVVRDVGQRALVLAPTLELLEQWADEIRDVLDVEPGMIGDGNWSEGPVTVASIHTLAERGTDDLANYGVAIFDECHRTSAADTFHDVGMALDVAWRVGLSATPWRRIDGEELKIEGATGGVVFEVGAAKLIEAGHLTRPEWQLIDPVAHGDPSKPRDGEDWSDAYRRCVVECEVRNRAISATVAALAWDGYSVLVAVDRIEHGERLASDLAGMSGVGDVVFLCGEDSTERRQEVLEAFDRGDISVVVSTLLGEGVDLPELNAIVLAAGKKSDVKQIQQIGRALRPAGGDHAVIADVCDRGRYLGDHFDERIDAYGDYYGRYGPDWRDSDVGTVREWLDRNGQPLDELEVSDTDRGVRIEAVGWIDDFDAFTALMRDTPGVTYDFEEQVNYVEEPERLEGPEPVVA